MSAFDPLRASVRQARLCDGCHMRKIRAAASAQDGNLGKALAQLAVELSKLGGIARVELGHRVKLGVAAF